jgi:hypothetical protein
MFGPERFDSDTVSGQALMIRADDGADLHHVAGSHPPLAISQIAASDNTAEPRTATGPTGRLPTDQAPGKRGRWTANHRATAPSDGGQARSNQSPIACVPTEARSRVEPLNISRLSNVAVEKSQRPAGNSRRCTGRFPSGYLPNHPKPFGLVSAQFRRSTTSCGLSRAGAPRWPDAWPTVADNADKPPRSVLRGCDRPCAKSDQTLRID